ncbi:hypothetical protein PYW07_006986 [Mythimna separata]|uniref:Protein cueball n=1 Tax=Mythimna separata TaxID=271217 RepID=A0AAD7Z270_MYTSE|nr:hypothetical protein PYW07_006986 [Mythimna separata]
MCGARVLVLLALLVSSAMSFSWDIVVGGDKTLNFYFNGTLTHTKYLPDPTSSIESVTYDPINYRVLFSHFNAAAETISSFDLRTRDIKPVFTKKPTSYVRVVYDHVTQALYWKENSRLFSFSLDSASSNQTEGGNLLITLDNYCFDIAVDGCGGYIYWITNEEIERAQLDGSEREVLIKSKVFNRRSLAIDIKTQTIYWIERTHNRSDDMTIKRANLNGKNTTTLYNIAKASYASSLTLSEEFIYWENYGQKGIWQLPKNSSENKARKLHTKLASECAYCQLIAINYTIKEQIQGLQRCDTLQIPFDSKSESTVSICQNYCFQGDCSVSDGHPTCSCKAGFSGERCDLVNACYDYCLHSGICSLNKENKRVCHCTVGYLGERCEVQVCHEYCLNGGICSLTEEDEPVCECTAGYDGGRCEVSANNSCDAGKFGEGKVSACHQFCLNNGVCFLNEASEPVCQCPADYEGDRCEVSVNKDFCFQAACGVSADGQPTVTVTLGKGVQSTCASTVPEDFQDTKKLTEFKRELH